MVEYLSGDDTIHKLVSPIYSENPAPSEQVDAWSKPKITIKKSDEGVIVNFNNNLGDAIRLYSKRSNEDDFQLLSEQPDLSYIDKRPNAYNVPELREYMAHYVKNNVKVGQASDIVLIIKK